MRWGRSAYRSSYRSHNIGWLFMLAVWPLMLFGQSRTQIRPAGPDAGVVIPTTVGNGDQNDSAAMAEISASAAAMHASSWRTMQATGNVTNAVGGAGSFPAVFSSASGFRSRLDIQTQAGRESTRISWRTGKYQSPDQRIQRLEPDTALAGIFPFQEIFAAQDKLFHLTITDDGFCRVSGVDLHRITVGVPAAGTDPNTKNPHTFPIDFYFDPTSHLLVKTVTYATLRGNSRVRFMRVITYGDYRQVSSVMLPFRYTETIDGEVSRIFQVSSVQVDPVLSSTYFEF